MMPLWTIATPSREMCGWAFLSFGTPCVAQRVWAMPRWPEVGCAARASESFDTLPTARRRATSEPPFRTATPAES